MILFCDTSALLKLYVREAYASELRALAAEAGSLAVCRVAWAEAFAGLSRRAREEPHNAAIADEAKRALARDWAGYTIADATQAVVERAGLFSESFSLRGYDSVQLAAAKQIEEAFSDEVAFACFDRRLNVAARALGMETPFGDSRFRR